METLSNLASSASKAVFGDQTAQVQDAEEPVSGKTGSGTVDEPYDQGNTGQEPEAPTAEEPLSGETGKGTPNEPYDQGNASEQPTQPDTTTTTGAAEESKTETSNLPSKPETASTNAPTSAVKEDPVTSVGDPSSAQAPTETQQGAERPTDEPSTEQTEAVKDKKAAAEDVATDAPTAEESKHTEEGTGEKYVRSSGLAAEGGDFDATKPGAGKEADRLLEQKDVRKESAASAGSTEPAGKDSPKVSKVSKLKEKLHIGSKK